MPFLDDQAVQVLQELARPLDPPLRNSFLQSVLNDLANYPPEQIGPGLVSRIARPLQQEFTRGLRKMADNG
jgi:hypothetical protein